MTKKIYFICIILIVLFSLTGCGKSGRSEEEQIAYDAAVAEARSEYLLNAEAEFNKLSEENGLSFSLNDRDKKYLNSLFDYLLYTHEIRELQLNDGRKKEIEALQEKQTEAMKGISLYIKINEIASIRFEILDEKGAFDEGLFEERLTTMLVRRLLIDSFRVGTDAYSEIQNQLKELWMN